MIAEADFAARAVEVSLETSLGCLVLLDLVEALDPRHLLPPAFDVYAGEVKDASERLEDRAGDVVLGVVLQVAVESSTISQRWLICVSRGGSLRVSEVLVRIEGPVDLLGSGLGLDEDVGDALAMLGLSTRVELHRSCCDCRAWRRVPVLPGGEQSQLGAGSQRAC